MIKAYKDFGEAFRLHAQDPIAAVCNGDIPLYAIDNSLEDDDWIDVFDKIGFAKKYFANICKKPKSHLKSVNEIRPIDTVKRVGYESIPYLASHSEDWLTRTATGLKPARLFSRVEDDDFFIYENRVTKTLIDIVITYLRKEVISLFFFSWSITGSSKTICQKEIKSSTKYIINSKGRLRKDKKIILNLFCDIDLFVDFKVSIVE